MNTPKTQLPSPLAEAPGSATCHECGGHHEPSGSRSDCIRHWKLRAIQAENELLVKRIYGDALERIRRFPVHSEPVGGAYAMQDIAHDALAPNDPSSATRLGEGQK